MSKKEVLETYLYKNISNGLLPGFEPVFLMGVFGMIAWGIGEMIWVQILIGSNIVIACIFTIYIKKYWLKNKELIFLHAGVMGEQTQIVIGIVGIEFLRGILSTRGMVSIYLLYIVLCIFVNYVFYLKEKKKLNEEYCSKGGRKYNPLSISIIVAVNFATIVIVRQYGYIFEENVLFSILGILFMLCSLALGGIGSIYRFVEYKKMLKMEVNNLKK